MTVSLGVLLCVLVAGCGPGVEGRYPIHGTVTYNGQPLSEGSIVFVPASSGGKLMKVGAPIKNGQYELPAKFGAFPGSYKVQITWMKSTGRKVKDIEGGDEVMEMGEVIPAKFNTATTLTAEVKPESNSLNFDLKGEPLGNPVPKTTALPDM